MHAENPKAFKFDTKFISRAHTNFGAHKRVCDNNETKKDKNDGCFIQVG